MIRDLFTGVILVALCCSTAAMGVAPESERERGRLDPYSADYRIVDEYRLRLGTSGRYRDGRTWSTPEKWEGLYEFPDDAGGRRIEAEAIRLGDICGGAGGRYGDKGFLRLRPSYLLKMARRDRGGAKRTLLRGRTAYEGTEDMEPGSFTCMLEGGRVTLWVFDPD